MTDGNKIKVLLIDNHPLVLDGLRAVLETFGHIEIVGTAALAQTGLEIARQTRPAVILMDINMPKLSGIDAIELFRNELPNSRILMLSMHDSKEYISTSVMRGASGYLLKDVSTNEIVTAIETVAAGKSFFSSGVSEVLLERQESEGDVHLTAREQEVLLLLAGGKSNRDIASSLAITEATAETHRKNIKKKLGIASTAGLIRFALEKGLSRPES
ncbi:response regulator transcription factor [Phyllobacterium sp. 21LDTY02-6]|jgi:two-component system, NarL family, nitrate/nitrite response regulator NarL|uniref:response regulator transcription factor n=1 Tax=unclassified Phyllobacterium TaxID=2638441 RepID=UPI0020208F85|nr:MULTISPECIES: response regulator transcription factor [unclassified Phyllobacterium]MCO4317958.1 response regulator transcription factor [Phyllobacterium sp. 21LDTY02-6]MCX8282139.1 response regulator transcription factor [Phyllobacterium sp. 0TCS1.6C]MCX8296347.1 response regulator transcription factor [Phyllobacterium sp. 0TCS1.6A]